MLHKIVLIVPSGSSTRVLHWAFLSLALFTVCTSSTDSISPRGPMPDTADLAESVLAPFLSLSHSFVGPGGGAAAVVCGGTGAASATAAPRLLVPATLRDMARGHAALDAAAECFLRAAGRDLICAAGLRSAPADCGMRITDATEYWLFFRGRLGPVLYGGAEVLVAGLTRVGATRERLLRSVRRTQEATQAGRELWMIVSQGWERNARQEDNVAFASAVTARGEALVKEAYNDVMEKYRIVKEWMQTSLGVYSGSGNTYNGRNGSLLGPQSNCDVSTQLDEWLASFDQTYYTSVIVSSAQRELESLFSGYKNFDKTYNVDIDPVHHLPCVAFSFAIAMMLLEDFPIRLAHWDIVNTAREKNNADHLWPLSRFAMLGDRNASSTRGRLYLLQVYENAMEILSRDQFVLAFFNGNASMASCVAQAVLRAPTPAGHPPPGSMYECLLSLPRAELGGSPNLFFVSKGHDPTPMCPWGFTRPSGNSWNAQEECVMCPTGSFGDGEGGCRCSAGSYPTDDGCAPREERTSNAMAIWRWGIKSSEVFVAHGSSSSSHSMAPILIATLPDGLPAREGNTIVVEVNCTTGLTQFNAVLPAPSHPVVKDTTKSAISSPEKLQNITLSPRRFLRLVSTSVVLLSVAASAAVGGEQCNIAVRLRNARYADAAAKSVGTVVVLPPAAAPRVAAWAHTDIAAACAALTGAPTTMGTVSLSACRAESGELALRVDARGYAPLSPESYGVVRQALWENGDRAKEFGDALRAAAGRIALILHVTGEGLDFHGNVSLTEGVRLFEGIPSEPVRFTVRLQVKDRCAMSNAAIDRSLCGNKKWAFADSEVTAVECSTNGAGDGGGGWANGPFPVQILNDLIELFNRKRWWGPLIALCVVDVLLLIIVGAMGVKVRFAHETHTKSSGVCPTQMHLNIRSLQEKSVRDVFYTNPPSPGIGTRMPTPESS